MRVAWFSRDGDRVLTCSNDRTAQVWDAATGEPVTRPLKHKSAVSYASFSNDGLRVLTTSRDGTARVWDAATGEPISPPLWHGQAIHHGSFSPDGLRVATTSDDNTARVWDLVTGERLTLGWQPNNVRKVSFSPDGRLIATTCAQRARVWDAATGEPLTGALRHEKDLNQIEFSPDGHQLLTASSDGTARLWELLPDDRPVKDLVLLAQVLCGHTIGATGGGLEPVEPGALRDAWQSLRDKYPDDFVASPEDLSAWHREVDRLRAEAE